MPSKRRLFEIAIVAVAIFLVAGRVPTARPPVPATPAETFAKSCGTCHGNPNVEDAPDLAKLRQMSPESIYATLTIGDMRVEAQNLSDDMKLALPEYLAGRRLGIGRIADAKVMPNGCSNVPPIDLSGSPMWNGWGVDMMNSRFEPGRTAGLSAGQVHRLKLKWAFGFPGASTVYSQPTLAAGRLFVGVDTGYVYAINAATGCVYWSFAAQAGVRSAISIGKSQREESARYAAYFGDIRGNVYAVDAKDGELL